MKQRKDLFVAWAEALGRTPAWWKTVLPAMLFSVILIGGYIFTAYTSHEMHKFAQHNEKLYRTVMSCDFISFAMHGGNPLGYQNYFKWNYAKWRKAPERTWLEKILFWDTGIIYDASNPPTEYQYPFLGVKN